jgi:hypothetical protein
VVVKWLLIRLKSWMKALEPESDDERRLLLETNSLAPHGEMCVSPAAAVSRRSERRSNDIRLTAAGLVEMNRDDLLAELRGVAFDIESGALSDLPPDARATLPHLAVSYARADDPQLVAACVRVAEWLQIDQSDLLDAWHYLAAQMQTTDEGFGLISGELRLLGQGDSVLPRLALVREVLLAMAPLHRRIAGQARPRVGERSTPAPSRCPPVVRTREPFGVDGRSSPPMGSTSGKSPPARSASSPTSSSAAMVNP